MIETQRQADTLDLLAGEAIALVGDKPRAILGITGSPGAGKSTLTDLLLARIRAAKGAQWVGHVPMDGFHLADAQLDRLGVRSRKGAPDTFDAAGYAHLLERLKLETDTPVYVPGFERTLEQPLAAALVVLPTARLVITEGNYLLVDDPLWARARAAIDTVWFVAGEDGPRIRTSRRPPRPLRQDLRRGRRLGHHHRSAQLRTGVHDPRQGRPCHRQRCRGLDAHPIADWPQSQRPPQAPPRREVIPGAVPDHRITNGRPYTDDTESLPRGAVGSGGGHLA